MSNRVRIILAILALCCVISFSLLLVFNDAIRSFVLDPIVKSINSVRYVVGYIPQDLEWLIGLLIVFIVVVTYYTSRIPKRLKPKHIPLIPPFPHEGPTMKLAQILERTTHNKFRRERVILELRDLAAHTLAYHKGISVDEAKDSLDTSDWTDNPSVRDFLSLDKHRAGKHEHKEFHDQVDHALAQIERAYQEV